MLIHTKLIAEGTALTYLGPLFNVLEFLSGFLDGGDRALPLDSRSTGTYSPAPRSNNQDTGSANSSSTSISANDLELSSLTTSRIPTPTLLVINLPSLLFSQTQDMHPLFYPFGRIKKLSLVDTPLEGTTSVIVEYETAAIAQEAKEALHGQFYIGHEITAHYVGHKSALLDLAPVSDSSYINKNAPHVGFDSSARPSLLGPVNFDYGSVNQGQRFSNSFQHSGSRASHPSGFDRHILRAGPVTSR
ncbi:hypothetical protein H0H87_011938 [Tephrocybe sp. NHM501043]|nr:hypothetical protein H0H87_011938 [Tephrocybe sp. NHM501043]